MSNTQLFYALVLPGVGHQNWGLDSISADWAVDKPIAIYDGDPEGVPGVEDYALFNLIDIGSAPDHLGGSIRYREGSLDVGSISFDLIIDGPQKPDYLQYQAGASDSPTSFDLGKFLTTRRIESAGLLAQDLTTSGTSIVLWSRSGANFVTGDIVYLEDETLFLEAQTLVDPVNNTQTFTVQRGCFGSSAAPHKTDPVAPNPPEVFSGYDNRIWLEKDPKDIPCYVIEWDGSTLDIVWRGLMTQAPKTLEQGLLLRVEPQDAFKVLTNRPQNEEPYGTSESGFDISYAPHDFIVHRTEVSNKNNLWGGLISRPTGNTPTVLQFGDKLLPVYWDADSKKYKNRDPSGVFTVYGDFQKPLDVQSPYEDAAYEDYTSATELVVVGRGATAETSTGYRWSVTSAHKPDQYAHHPLHLFLCYVLSTGRHEFQHSDYDIWGVGVGCAIPIEMVDVEGIRALIAARPQEEIYFSTLGWGGSSYSFRDVVNKWLLPFRYYVHVTSDYKITISRLEVVLASDATEVLATDLVSSTEEQDLGWDDTLKTASAKANYPWDDERTIVISDASQGLVGYDPRPVDPKLDIDVSCLKPSSAVVGGSQRVALDGLLQFYRRAVPVYTFKVVPGQERFYPGQKLALKIDVETHPVFLGADGEYLKNGDSVLGIVQSVGMDFISGVTEISLAGINDALVATPKKLAPSFELTGLDGVGTYAFSSNEFGVEEVFDWLTRARSEGWEVDFWNARTGFIANGEILSTVTLSAGKVEVTFGGALITKPVIGDTLRLPPRSVTSGLVLNGEFTYTASVAEVFSDDTPGDIFV